MVEGKGLWSVKLEKHGSTKYSVLFPILFGTYSALELGTMPHAPRESCYLRCTVRQGVADGSLVVAGSADCD